MLCKRNKSKRADVQTTGTRSHTILESVDLSVLDDQRISGVSFSFRASLEKSCRSRNFGVNDTKLRTSNAKKSKIRKRIQIRTQIKFLTSSYNKDQNLFRFSTLKHEMHRVGNSLVFFIKETPKNRSELGRRPDDWNTAARRTALEPAAGFTGGVSFLFWWSLFLRRGPDFFRPRERGGQRRQNRPAPLEQGSGRTKKRNGRKQIHEI